VNTGRCLHWILFLGVVIASCLSRLQAAEEPFSRTYNARDFTWRNSITVVTSSLEDVTVRGAGNIGVPVPRVLRGKPCRLTVRVEELRGSAEVLVEELSTQEHAVKPCAPDEPAPFEVATSLEMPIDGQLYAVFKLLPGGYARVAWIKLEEINKSDIGSDDPKSPDQIRLKDGTVLRGTLTQPGFVLKCALGALDVPWRLTTELRHTETNNWTASLVGGDRLSGTPDLKAVEMVTLLGKMRAELELVKAVTVGTATRNPKPAAAPEAPRPPEPASR
jgi:hypothetical protein